VRTNPAAPTQDAVIYAEDHCGLRWPLILQAIGWPILLIAALATLFLTSNPALAYLPAIATGGTLFAVVATVISRPIGIRITATGISIGGVLRQHHHSAGSETLPPATAQRKELFSCPWTAVRHIEVVTGRKRIKELARYRSDHGRIRLGALWTPFMTATLVMQVDVAGASVPQFRPPDTQRYWFKPSRPDPYTVSSTWYAPTRHPDELRQALTAFVAAPQTADDEHGADRQDVG
jgi:hypothetical protein